MAVLCVDAGTTMVKAVIFDDEGRELTVARRATVVRRAPGGVSEQDMDAVWDAVVHTIGAVVRQVSEPVRMLAFTGQGDGCWLVGADGRPTGPAVLWNDGRAAGIVDRWDADGVLAEAFRINGTLGFPGTSSAIMKWLHENDRARLDASDKALYCDGWLFHRFTGEFAVDESDAASPFLDIRTRRYSPRLFELYDMPWVERLLPDVRDDAHRVGELRAEVAAGLRLRPGLPVVMAPFDIPATAIGIGAIEPAQACTILGTTLSTEMILAEPETTGTAAGMTLPSGVDGTFVRSLAAMAGSEVISWAMRLIGLDDPGSLSDLAAGATPGAGGLFFHPYLSPAGERAPFRDPGARGSLLGLSFEHGRSHIARAILEGLSFVVRDCLESGPAPAAELRLCGGGAGSSFWCRLLADVTGIPTSRSADAEIGAKGAFLNALVATGREATMRDATARVRTKDVFEPRPAAARVYDELFGDFLELRKSAFTQWPRLARARVLTEPGELPRKFRGLRLADPAQW
jgi:erythritol kinase (D-erythritol 1-phosphate-forming)